VANALVEFLEENALVEWNIKMNTPDEPGEVNGNAGALSRGPCLGGIQS
jgi:hypothetical protein